MKKYIFGGAIGSIVIIGLIVCVLFLNNGSTKKLKCVKAESLTGLNITSTFDITFKNNVMSLIKLKSENVLTEDTYKNNIDVLFDALQEKYKEAKENKGVIVKPSKTKDSVAIEITVNAKQSPDQVGIVGSSITNKMNYSEIKEELEKRNYVCE